MLYKVIKEHEISRIVDNIFTRRIAQIGETGKPDGYWIKFPDGYIKFIGGNDFQDPDEVIKEFYEKIGDER